MDESVHDKARRIRDREIAALQRCNCEYPIQRYRNGHGHGPGCPAGKPPGRALGIGISVDDADDMLRTALDGALAMIVRVATEIRDRSHHEVMSGVPALLDYVREQRHLTKKVD